MHSRSDTIEEKELRAFSTVTKDYLPEKYPVTSEKELDMLLQESEAAFRVFSETAAAKRADFLDAIAEEIIAVGEPLINTAHLESGLPLARLNGERDRTVAQLRMFAAVLREGSFVEAVIDTAMPERKPLPRADLRKMQVPLGPVAVFGASNFPFAFSTAGGDTASALAAGCTVVVKAHPSHPGTHRLMAEAIQKAIGRQGLPEGVFASVSGDGIAIGQQLAKHPAIKAIGFTGSFKGGMALYNTAAQEREVPIPVYAEMSSINPVLLLPGKTAADPARLAKIFAGSITLGVGQFCTNPGLLFALKSADTDLFMEQLTAEMKAVSSATMLNQAICKSYYSGRKELAAKEGVTVLFEGADDAADFKGSPALFKVSASDFMRQSDLQEEVFGPSSLIVLCENPEEMEAALSGMHGQLTGSVFGTNAELPEFRTSIRLLQDKVGRIMFNNVPTGVEVCHAMVHGGPFPATTDAKFTSVGAEALRRFMRPVCFQNWPAELLPECLKDDNVLGIMRKVDGNFKF